MWGIKLELVMGRDTYLTVTTRSINARTFTQMSKMKVGSSFRIFNESKHT